MLFDDALRNVYYDCKMRESIMEAKKLSSGGGALSMKFRTYTDTGEVALDVSSEERAQLVDFIDKSLSTTQVDYDSHSPVNFDELRHLRDAIAAQAGSDAEPLVVGRADFWQLVKAASTWHHMGYSGVPEGVELDVPRPMVDRICAVGDSVPLYIGPPEV